MVYLPIYNMESLIILLESWLFRLLVLPIIEDDVLKLSIMIDLSSSPFSLSIFALCILKLR